MKTIYIKVLRDLKKMKMHTLAIILTLACGVGVSSGVDMAIQSLFFTRDKIFEDMHFADLEVQLLPEDVRNLPDFSDIPGIKKIEKRLLMPGTINLKQGRNITALMVFMDNLDPEINQVKIVKGRKINPDIIKEAIAERTLNDYHGISPGDKIEVKIGQKIYKNEIAGIGISPEYVVISANPEYFLPEKGSLGVIFSSLKQIDENLGFTMVNDLLFSYKDGVDKKTVQNAIIDRFKNTNLERVIPFKEHFTYKYLEMDINAFKLYIPAIVLVLGSLSFIITLINFSRLLQQQQKEIGAIIALGYHPMEIVKAYAFGAVIICAGGILIGFPLSLLLRDIFINVYISASGLIYSYKLIFFSSIMKGIIFALFTIGISFYIPLHKLLKLSPREIIHPAIRDNVSANPFTRFIVNITEKFSIAKKIGIRNVFREYKRAFSTIFAIALACGVASSYMLSMTSTIKTVEERFKKGKWQIVADFLYPVHYEDYEELKKIPGVTAVEPFFRHYVEIGNGDMDHLEGSGMLGIIVKSVMRELPLISGHELKNKEEIILSHDLVKKLKFKIGDKVMVKVGMKKFYFTLAGIKSDVVIGESFIDFYRAREIFEFQDEASGVFLKGNPELFAAVEEEIYKKEFTGKVTFKSHLVEEFLKMMDEMTKMVDVSTAISVFVAVLFIFTGINMGISEREGEYATLKAIGYNKKLIRTIVFSESALVGILSAIISIPVAILISWYLNYRMSEAWFNTDSYYAIKDFASVIIPMFILIPLSIIPSLKYLVKMNIPETLRTKIIE